jgi:hypothetical protein
MLTDFLLSRILVTSKTFLKLLDEDFTDFADH